LREAGSAGHQDSLRNGIVEYQGFRRFEQSSGIVSEHESKRFHPLGTLSATGRRLTTPRSAPSLLVQIAHQSDRATQKTAMGKCAGSAEVSLKLAQVIDFIGTASNVQ
jgi:hypothetical protein